MFFFSLVPPSPPIVNLSASPLRWLLARVRLLSRTVPRVAVFAMIIFSLSPSFCVLSCLEELILDPFPRTRPSDSSPSKTRPLPTRIFFLKFVVFHDVFPRPAGRSMLSSPRWPEQGSPSRTLTRPPPHFQCCLKTADFFPRALSPFGSFFNPPPVLLRPPLPFVRAIFPQRTPFAQSFFPLPTGAVQEFPTSW